MDEVSRIIAELRVRLDVSTDSELARKLRIDKSTIAAWKSRGNVPDRYRKIAAGESHQAISAPPLKWSDHEKAAFSLALFRYSRAYAQEIAVGDYHTMLRVFGLQNWQIWALHAQAQKELADEVGRSGCAIHTALALMIHRDIELGHEAVTQHREMLRARSPSARIDGVERPWP